tara:strand:+ start:324 stop:1214 length:891 start_codon:yes stop_codon:yes gene_type:complete
MDEMITESMPLGDLNAGLADTVAKAHDKKPSEIEFVRKGVITKSEADEEERSSTELISTKDVDRDNEILLPRGADLTYYKQNPQVLWAHQYNVPPIGRAVWVKKKSEGLLAKTIYAATDLATEIWELVKGGFLPARSVGFIPIESHEPDEKELRKYPERTGARRVIDKWELLEYSVVPVPSNRQALQTAMAKGLVLSYSTIDSLGVQDLTDEGEGSFVIPKSVTDDWDTTEFLKPIEDEPERSVELYKRVKDTGRYVRDTGRRVIVRHLPDKVLDAKAIIEYKVGQELRRKRGRIT